jgi:hypothetical protein
MYFNQKTEKLYLKKFVKSNKLFNFAHVILTYALLDVLC